MRPVLLDTVAWAMALAEPERLSPAAREAIETRPLCLSAITQYEIAWKVRAGKWAAMERFVDSLALLAATHGVTDLAVDGGIAFAAARSGWGHRDPFDRLIWATAVRHDLPVVTSDEAFLSPSFDLGIQVVW